MHINWIESKSYNRYVSNGKSNEISAHSIESDFQQKNLGRVPEQNEGKKTSPCHAILPSSLYEICDMLKSSIQ